MDVAAFRDASWVVEGTGFCWDSTAVMLALK